MIENLFVASVLTEQLDIDNNKIKNYCYDVKNRKESVSLTNLGGWQSPPISTNESSLKELFDAVGTSLCALHTEFNFRNDKGFVIDNCWININGYGHSNSPHNHRGWTFSGVYYVQAEENCGDIVFMHPSSCHQYHYEDNPFKIKTIQHGSSTVAYKPNTGKLIIMPSWLFHFVRPNLSTNDRISIAFDVI